MTIQQQAEISYRRMRPGEEAQVMALVGRVFHQFVAPHFCRDGVTEFLKYANPAALAERCRQGHVVLVAALAAKLVGMVEIRDHQHIGLFFVDAPVHGTGIGRALLREVVGFCRNRQNPPPAITVNASPNAVAFYRTAGFVAQNEEQEVNGIRFTSMALARDRW